MAEKILEFYEALAEHYHLIFDDWDSAIERQARILGALLTSQISVSPLKILDCACGIGTQAIGFAAMGHRVVASDLSWAAVKRAQQEALCRSLKISFYVSDMTSLLKVAESEFDVVAAMDNALPHLNVAQLRQAARDSLETQTKGVVPCKYPRLRQAHSPKANDSRTGILWHGWEPAHCPSGMGLD